MIVTNTNKYSILYVEDDKVMTYLFKRTYGEYFDVKFANTAEEAKEILESTEIHLIITDQYLPGMSGTELLKSVIPTHPNIMKILVTGSDDLDIIEEAINECGISHFISKPWKDETFLFAINKALETYQLRIDKEKAQKDLENAYKELKDTHAELVLTKKMASLGLLTAGIAHEINNPINYVYAGINALEQDFIFYNEIIKLYEKLGPESENCEIFKEIDLLKNKLNYEELKADIERLISDIRVGANRTKEIVVSLRNFSRADEAEQKRADIHQGIDSTLVLLHSKYKGRIEVIKNYDPEVKPIMCYPGQLNQVFMNLISNSIDSITESGTITIQTIDSSSSIDIIIEDTGCGIPEEVKEKIFDPFFTTKDVGKGTGLGLSITYGIIKKHNAEIKVESETNKGTKFIITLPKE
ncbi:MAG: ATP-binding protein [Cyclobacteriaceae bacterium]|nr:ATP-binding protein [Cyclobacteriaceae bacterium]